MDKFVAIYNAIIDCIVTILSQFDVEYPEWLDKDLEIAAK